MPDRDPPRASNPGTEGRPFVEEPAPVLQPRRFRVALVLTAIPGLIGSMMLAIFTSFGRPDVGLAVVGVLFLPMVVPVWWGYAASLRRARTRLEPNHPVRNDKAPPGI